MLWCAEPQSTSRPPGLVGETRTAPAEFISNRIGPNQDGIDRMLDCTARCLLTSDS